MSVTAAIERAKAAIGNSPIEHGDDPRWQAIIAVGEYLGSDADAVWAFIEEFHDTRDEDLRAAVSTCLLEHLLEQHPQYRARAEQLASRSPEFRRMLQMCWSESHTPTSN